MSADQEISKENKEVAKQTNNSDKHARIEEEKKDYNAEISNLGFDDESSGSRKCIKTESYKRPTKASALGKSAGRWTKPEHTMFIEGLKKYGRNWK